MIIPAIYLPEVTTLDPVVIKKTVTAPAPVSLLMIIALGLVLLYVIKSK